ncbi:immunity 26/phosphotriesterase HocA family protein [Listeria ivanovii]|uniref:immunity 26/phosphotriesterase HocA family protein n=1 Tax=Listeria ivanovii TaxID=1638 RepID=UPI00190D37D2|nr:immunity 26/phosphotriesterase HocA family protein [Listeria ivanovii]MBK3913088.1 hypothetical protein [Listeria ivanovii subsp. ivanovii]MBK3920795.1 hypothetical protein [Listeria ivanovii subsp. ivanovii]MBK3925379.1 hypothetical protein [Listeria ivanovii subsp. ivanovii]
MINKEIRGILGLKQITKDDQIILLENAKVIIRNNLLIKLMIDESDFYKEIDYNLPVTEANELIGRKGSKTKALTLNAIMRSKTKEMRLKINKASHRIELKLGVQHFPNLYFGEEALLTKENIQKMISDTYGSYDEWTRLLAKSNLKVKTRQTIKQGDIFSYPIGNEYGFALVIGCFQAYRKQEIIPTDRNHYLKLMMGVPLVIRTFNYTSEQNTVDTGVLREHSLLNPEFIMDDLVLRGKFPIIGTIKLKEADILLPMNFSFNGISTTYVGYQTIDASDLEIIKWHQADITVRFDWGFGTKTMAAKEFLKRCGTCVKFLPYSGLGMNPVANFSEKLLSLETIFSEAELKHISELLNIDVEMTFDSFNEAYDGINRQKLLNS